MQREHSEVRKGQYLIKSQVLEFLTGKGQGNQVGLSGA